MGYMALLNINNCLDLFIRLLTKADWLV